MGAIHVRHEGGNVRFMGNKQPLYEPRWNEKTSWLSEQSERSRTWLIHSCCWCVDDNPGGITRVIAEATPKSESFGNGGPHTRAG